MVNKKLCWEGSSYGDLLSLTCDAQRKIGYQLHLLQTGHEPSDWKPISTVGLGVRETRIRTSNHYRVIYVAKYSEAIYVLHVFKKKTQKTSTRDIDIARSRYHQLVERRKK